MRGTVWGVLVVLPLLTACGKQAEPAAVNPGTGRFAALAVSKDGRSAAYALYGVSEQDADETALEKCRRAEKADRGTCTIRGRTTRGCMAEATDIRNSHLAGVGLGATAEQACANAVAACAANKGIGCQPSTYGCMDGRPVDLCLLIDSSEAPPAAQSATPERSPPTKRTGPYGAIAVGRNGDRAGTSFGHATHADAEAAAEAACRHKGQTQIEDCAPKVWFKDACGALAVGKNATYGTGWAKAPARACQWALATCQKSGGIGCEGTIYSCSPLDEWGFCDGRFKSKH